MTLERERDNQGWVYDLMVKMTGRTHNFAYDHRDLPPEVKSHAMIPRVMERQARPIQALADEAEARGERETALSLYCQALQPYHLAQHAIYRDDDQEKVFLHAQLQRCFAGAIRNAEYQIEKVEIPFEGGSIEAYLHLVPGSQSRPALVYCPGMDQTKESYPRPHDNHFLKRGMHVLSIDGPGQGMSNMRKLRLTLDNYERAGQAAIDWLCARPEVDPARIGVFGSSMGSHWATQIAATDGRVKAVATSFACYTGKHLLFDVASPRFKRIFMYMTGIHDEVEFDRFAAAYTLDEYFTRLDRRVLMVHGEYDPLSDLDEALKLYELIPGNKEFWIVENDFHMPLGRRNFGGLDIYHFLADWLRASLNAPPGPPSRREVIVADSSSLGPYGAQMLDHRLPGRLGV